RGRGMTARVEPVVRWTAPTRATLAPLERAAPDPEQPAAPVPDRHRCACGRQVRASDLYDTRALAQFPGDWTCDACIGHARDTLGTVTERELLSAWAAPE